MPPKRWPSPPWLGAPASVGISDTVMAILIVDLDWAPAGSANETIAPVASTAPQKLMIDLRIAVHKAFP